MGGPCEQFWHGQGCPLSNVPLPTKVLPTLQGALTDGFGEAVVAHRYTLHTICLPVDHVTLSRVDNTSQLPGRPYSDLSLVELMADRNVRGRPLVPCPAETLSGPQIKRVSRGGLGGGGWVGGWVGGGLVEGVPRVSVASSCSSLIEGSKAI